MPSNEYVGHQEELSCPYCGAKMEQGYLDIRTSFWGGILAWFAPVNCYFNSKNGEKVNVLKRFYNRAALHCSSCGAVLSKGSNT